MLPNDPAPALVADRKRCELYFKMQTWDGLVSSEAICIKAEGNKIEFPETVQLFTKGKTRANQNRYCNPAATETQGDGVTCAWNKRFYDKVPLDFSFCTNPECRNGVASSPPVSKFVSLVRAMRNSNVVFSWKGSGTRTNQVLTIPGSSLVTTALYDQPVELSLYVLPSGADEAKAAEAKAQSRILSDWRTNLNRGLQAVVAAEIPPELSLAYRCFRAQAEYLSHLQDAAALTEARQKIEHTNDDITAVQRALDAPWKLVAHAKAPQALPKRRDDGGPLQDGDVAIFEDASGRYALHAFSATDKAWRPGARPKDYQRGPVVVALSDGRKLLFDDLPQSGPHAGRPIHASPRACAAPTDAGDALRNAVTKRNEAQLGEVSRAVEEVRGAIEAALALLPAERQRTIRESLFWVQNVERVSLAALGAVEEVRKSLPSVAAAAKAAATDPKAYERGYLAFARAIPDWDTAVVHRVPNPAPGPDELSFDMTFHNPAQKYWFLAWNGLPIGVFRESGVQTELRAENLIPFVDIHGGSYQVGKAIGHASLGVGVLGARETIRRPDGSTYETAFNLGLQVNGSIRGFRVGAAYLVREPDGGEKDYQNNVRILFGADLLKLFTGRNTAAIEDGAAPEAGAH